MDTTELYAGLLGITSPWRVSKVLVNVDAERIDGWVEETSGTKFPCGRCRQPVGVYDHTDEQVWRPLDTCQYQTFVHARLPRTSCPADGVKHIPAPWAKPRSQFTRRFECRLIETLTACAVTGVTRLMATTWDATWGVMERAVERGRARKAKQGPARLLIGRRHEQAWFGRGERI